MIKSKEDLREYIASDNKWYNPNTLKDKVIGCIANYPAYSIKRYLCYLRKQEYYINTAKPKSFRGLLGIWFERKKNRLGTKLGIEIGPNCFGKGVQIYHGNIVVNLSARIGENCILHGGNCIGNNGKTDISPIIGNNVDIGFGATLIGGIYIPDNTIIGANALVNRSFEEENRIIAGIPAKIIR